MKEIKKGKIFCGAAVRILFTSFLLPMTTAQYKSFLKQKNNLQTKITGKNRLNGSIEVLGIL